MSRRLIWTFVLGVVLFVLLGGLKMRAQWAALIALAVALVVAVAVYDMPVGQAADSALEGAVFGLWPIIVRADL